MVSQRKPKVKPPPSRLLSVAEAASRIGVSPRQMLRYLDSGLIDYGVLPSGRKKPTEASVNRFVERAIGGRL